MFEFSNLQTATWAARKALDASGVAPGRVGVICSTSVSRDCLEPSAAVCVQHALGLPPSCMNLDVSNACMGMMNGMLVVAGMIESGVCEYGLVVCSENLQVRLRCWRTRQPPTSTSSAKHSSDRCMRQAAAMQQ